MNKLYNIAFFLCWGLILFSSCTDELRISEHNSSNNYQLEKNEYLFDVVVDDDGTRTRDVSFDPRAALRLNKVWIGVFDMDNGNLVTSNSSVLDYRTITAGETAKGLIRMTLMPKEGYPLDANKKGFIMVCLGNYANVVDKNQQDLEDLLMNPDLTWRDFNNICVDVNSAYENTHNTILPVLAGFVYDVTKPAKSHIKIDQFAEKEDDEDELEIKPIQLSPNGMVNSILLKYNKNKELFCIANVDSQGNAVATDTPVYDSEGAALHLRRLVANINVIIEKDNDDIEITEVSYKRFNMPGHVYIIERRLTNSTIDNNGNVIEHGDFPSEAQYSPNSCDTDLGAYYNDPDWIYGNVHGFSFQHFANKHWATYIDKDPEEKEIPKLKEGIGREQLNANKAFTALVGEEGTPDDFNNYASFFVVKMHIIEKKTGRAVEAEYTIHEGNTSDELGNAIDENPFNVDGSVNWKALKGNPVDYSCARNMNYTYKITVKGFDNIYHNVVQGSHLDGQGGKIWELNYINVDDSQEKISNELLYDPATGTFTHAVDEDGGLFLNAIKIENPIPDLAFRLYGYNIEDDHIEGYNYNFPDQSFRWLNGLWPESAGQYSHYFKDFEELQNPQNTLDGKDIPDNISDGLRILDPANAEHMGFEIDANLSYGDGEDKKFKTKEEAVAAYITEHGWSIKDFIYHLHDNRERDEEGNLNNPNEQDPNFKGKEYHVWISKSNIETKSLLDRNKYVRAIYIADRLGKVDEVDQCTTLVTIYTVAQYPDKLKGQKFDFITPAFSPYSYEGGSNYQMANNLNRDDFSGTPLSNISNVGMVFSHNPDLAFRLLGYDGDTYYDICYGFNPADYPEFASNWPAVSNSTTQIDKAMFGTIPPSLLSGLKIANGNNNTATITDVVNSYPTGSQIVPTGFVASQYNKRIIGDDRIYMRALYVFDKNAFATNYLTDKNKVTTYQLYGVEQYPKQEERTKLNFTINSKINIEKYKVIDKPEEIVITVPLLNTTAFDGTRAQIGTHYRFELVIGSGDYSSYGKVDGTNYVFRIPDSKISGSGGNVSVTARTIHNYFADSDPVPAGTIEVKDHPTWKSGDNEDWDDMLKRITDNTNRKYLKTDLPNDNSKYGVSGGNISLKGNASFITVRVYSPCIITVSGVGGSQVGSTTDKNGATIYYGVYINWDDIENGLKFTSDNNGVVSLNITQDMFDNKESLLLKIRRYDAMTTDIKSISVSALE